MKSSILSPSELVPDVKEVVKYGMRIKDHMDTFILIKIQFPCTSLWYVLYVVSYYSWAVYID